ncbi:hypothetical protein DFJ74DRAFT_771038 [Hyaloraphidium curvatum]|nr:hypothetical protein DFJ74DRAFT_771038 [Hyaloraphidium curvatum]
MMLGIPLLLAAAMLLVGKAGAAQLPVKVGGRTVPVPGGLAFGWPGIYFEARFLGDFLTVAVESATDFYTVTIDGTERAVLRRPAAPGRFDFPNLGPGPHTVRLQKLTETQAGGGVFRGFFADGPLSPPGWRPRQVEFVGDSYTVGYGSRSPVRECSPQEVHDRTDTSIAYPKLAADILDADWRVIAYSGIGVARNWNGEMPGLQMPQIYQRSIPDDWSRLDEGGDGWDPDFVIVSLGLNDFQSPVHAGERWPDQASLEADFRSTYASFAATLLDRYPRAQAIFLSGPEYADRVAAARELIPPSLRGRTRLASFSDLELTGCGWHPSASDHVRIAEIVIAAARSGTVESGKPLGATCSASGPECASGCCYRASCTASQVCFGDTTDSLTGKPQGATCSASGPECASGCCYRASCAARDICFGPASTGTGKPLGATCSASGPECASGCCYRAACSANAVCFGGATDSLVGKPQGATCSASGPECASGCCYRATCSAREICFGPAPASGKPLGAGCSASGPECESGCCYLAACSARAVCFG